MDRHADQHDNVIRFSDRKVGLSVIVALHRPLSGFAMGGTRLLPYETEAEALADVLRLSEAMTYKAACAGVAAGGAKGVIIADPKMKSDDLLRAYARFVDSLRGRFVTGQDLNMTADDVKLMAQETPYMVGKVEGLPGPGLMTAKGVFEGLRGAAQVKLGASSLRNVRVAIQGIGEVGGRLAEMLTNAGADVIVTDVNGELAREVATRLGAALVAPDEIYDQDVEIFAPCGRGNVLSPATIPRLKALIGGGAANNQLADTRRDGKALQERGIAYCPDFVINAGGLIEVYCEYVQAEPGRADAMVNDIRRTIGTILAEADKKNASTHAVALDLAARRREDLEKAGLQLRPEQRPLSSRNI